MGFSLVRFTGRARSQRTSWFQDPPLRNASFSQLCVSFAAQVCAVALPTIAITTLDVGAFAASALLAAEFLPAAVLAPWLGSLADRMSPRKLLVGGSIVLAAVLVVVPVYSALGTVPLIYLYVVAGVVGINLALNDVVIQRYLPSIASGAHLNDANGAISAARSIAQLGGPALGGVVVGVVGGSYGLILATVAGLGAIVLCLRLPGELSARPLTTGQLDLPLSGVRDLTAILRADPFLARLMLMGAGLNLCGSALGGLYAFYVYRVLELSPLQFGVTLAAFSASALIAAVAASRIIGRLGITATVRLGSAVAGLSLLLIPAASLFASFLILVVYQCTFGFCSTLWSISSVGYRQQRYAPSILGKVTAVNRSVVSIVIPVGALGGGLLAAQAGVVFTCTVAAAIGAAFVLLTTFQPAHQPI